MSYTFTTQTLLNFTNPLDVHPTFIISTQSKYMEMLGDWAPPPSYPIKSIFERPKEKLQPNPLKQQKQVLMFILFLIFQPLVNFP